MATIRNHTKKMENINTELVIDFKWYTHNCEKNFRDKTLQNSGNKTLKNKNPYFVAGSA